MKYLLSVRRTRGAEPFPQGIIFAFDSTSIPDGWTRFASADSKSLFGAGGTRSPGYSSNGTVTRVQGTYTAGAHSSLGSLTYAVNGGATSVFGYPSIFSVNAGGGSLSGDHNHQLSLTYTMPYRQLVLIKSTTESYILPANTIIFGKTSLSPVSGLSIVYDNNILLRSGATITSNAGGFSSLSCGDGGIYSTEHAHETGGSFYTGNGSTTAYLYYGSASSGSTHTFTPSLVSQTLKRTYLAAWKGTNAFENASGIIGMWESVTPPDGWFLCNGSNGTIDLRDYFITLGTTSTAGNQYNESNLTTYSYSVGYDNWYHYHIGNTVNNVSSGATVAGQHTNESAYHTHTADNSTGTYLPPHYSLAFIQKI